MTHIHLTARARWPLAPFKDRDHCANMWRRLRRRYPRVLAAILMPNHLHLIIEAASPSKSHEALVRELSEFTRSLFPGQKLWEPIPPPSSIPDSHHLKRQIRYVHLNPCRSGLANDPLEWEWSTHRDVVGAAAPNWVDQAALARLFKIDARRLPEVFHAYVSGDPTVSVGGTPLPKALRPAELAVSFEVMESAVLQATRAKSLALRKRSHARRIAALLADRVGLFRPKRIADWLGVSPRGLRKALRKRAAAAENTGVGAALYLLSDPRRFTPNGRRYSEVPKSGT